MHPLRFGLIVAGLVCFIGSIQAKDEQPAASNPFPLESDSGPKPAVETYVPKDMSQAGLVKALEKRVVSLEAELKERRKSANHWYAQYLEYKALCQQRNNYQQVSTKGSWQKQCTGNQCKLVWVPASKPAPAKKAEPATKQAASCATGNCGVATSRRAFAGRWFR